MWEGKFSVSLTYPVFGNGFYFALKSLHISVLAFIMLYCTENSIIQNFYNVSKFPIRMNVN